MSYNKKLNIFLSSLVGLIVLSSCDAEDPTLHYEEQTAVGVVTLSSSLNPQQREVLTSLLNNMVMVENCQFIMGAQSRSQARANYMSSYSANRDSLKLTVAVDENGQTTYTKNNPFVDYVHLTDKTPYRHKLANGTVRTDTIYYTQVYRMPSATGIDNGHLWVGPVTEMCMPDDYYIGRYEVTQAEWRAVMSDVLPRGRRCIEVTSNDRGDAAWYAAVGLGDDYPAYNVWYEDALAFCDRLNQLCGMPDARGYRFRLPSEAEWECAARGGRYCRGYRYPGSDQYQEVAWCQLNAFTPGLTAPAFGMHPHGELMPNELGLYDMAGNVSEWVGNAYYRYTYRDSIATPAFNASRMPVHQADAYVGDTLILRGGSWYQGSSFAFGNASRQEYTHGTADEAVLQGAIMHCGFRLAFGK